MEEVSSHIAASGMYSLEYEVVGRSRLMSVRFWKDDVLVRFPMYHCSLTDGVPGSFFAGVSRLLSVISTTPKLVSVSGCSASVVQAFDDSEPFTHGVQYPFRFDAYSLPALLHQKEVNVFGAIDFISQLKFLILSLGGILIQTWTEQAPELTKVSIPTL